MTVTLIFLAILMAFVVWWLVRQTINVTPWEAQAAVDAVRSEGVRSKGISLAPAKVALGTFLAVVTSLFALFISAYYIRMEVNDWRPMPEYGSLWLNTAVLVAGSVALQWAWTAATRGERQTAKTGLVLAVFCTVGFIIGQFMVWQQLVAEGFALQGNPANAFFYTLTALHIAHLLGGMIALIRTIVRAWNPAMSDERISLSAELCAVYWHFLLVVWLVLFGLFIAT